MSIGRIFRWLAAAALIAVGVFWPLGLARQPGAASDTDLVRFSDYAADFVVDSDGNLHRQGVMRLATARDPKEVELKVLRETFDRRLAKFKASPDLANKLLATGESPRGRSIA